MDATEPLASNSVLFHQADLGEVNLQLAKNFSENDYNLI